MLRPSIQSGSSTISTSYCATPPVTFLSGKVVPLRIRIHQNSSKIIKHHQNSWKFIKHHQNSRFRFNLINSDFVETILHSQRYPPVPPDLQWFSARPRTCGNFMRPAVPWTSSNVPWRPWPRASPRTCHLELVEWERSGDVGQGKDHFSKQQESHYHAILIVDISVPFFFRVFSRQTWL